MENKERFFEKSTLIYTALCVFVVLVVGCIFLLMEHIDKSTIVKSENNLQIENAINQIHKSTDISEKEYSAEIFGLININSAKKEELMLLPGIGDMKADEIIEHRTNEPFQVIEDILKVDGISKKTFDKIKDSICVD